VKEAIAGNPHKSGPKPANSILPRGFRFNLIVGSEGVREGVDPEQEVLLAESVGVALLVMLEMLGPAEWAAFVLHELFHLPFDEIAPILGRPLTKEAKCSSIFSKAFFTTSASSSWDSVWRTLAR
jgi:hypothetical protein